MIHSQNYDGFKTMASPVNDTPDRREPKPQSFASCHSGFPVMQREGKTICAYCGEVCETITPALI
jgi:hypothetical protein